MQPTSLKELSALRRSKMMNHSFMVALTLALNPEELSHIPIHALLYPVLDGK